MDVCELAHASHRPHGHPVTIDTRALEGIHGRLAAHTRAVEWARVEPRRHGPMWLGGERGVHPTEGEVCARVSSAAGHQAREARGEELWIAVERGGCCLVLVSKFVNCSVSGVSLKRSQWNTINA